MLETVSADLIVEHFGVEPACVNEALARRNASEDQELISFIQKRKLLCEKVCPKDVNFAAGMP